MRRWEMTAFRAALVATLLVLVSGGGASARYDAATAASTDWLSFGNTLDQVRHSPLTQITPGNVDQLGRAFTLDLNRIVPGIRKGQQSYPIVVDGTMFVTSNDDQVFAVNAATGDLLWRYAPDNVATFRNFGIAVNRGVAVCDNRVFELTLDMTIVALDPKTGKQLARVPISHAVKGATANYGYSATSAPICANHRLIVGAAGSEYGVRGFVMAYHTPDLTPAWANPFWTIPPANTEWRRLARLVGGCTVWTPQTVDVSSGTLYFGTAAAVPPYYPSLRPGTNPRCSSLIAVNLATGKLKWWQQLIGNNEWSYDASQPPLVYTAKIGGDSKRVVSIATMEGVWFAFDAGTGAPIYQRVKVIDNVEHPDLKPGKPVAVYPASIGGLNYSPASFDPQTGYVYNAAAETAAVFVQQTSTQQQREAMLAGDVYLGLANGDYGQYLQSGWRDYGSLSAIDVATGKQVWKIKTPEPERGGVTTTDSGLGFAGGGDGNLRAFDVKTGKVLWTFQTGFQIASGPSIYSVDGKEYVAIGVGGTATSSGGGTVASQVQAFALGGSAAQSPAPRILGPMIRSTPAAADTAAPLRTGSTRSGPQGPSAAGAGDAARISLGPSLPVTLWDANSSNTRDIEGHVLLGGHPVVGAQAKVDGWLVPQLTDKQGSFTYPADITMAARHVVKVVGDAEAEVDGHKLSAAQQGAVLRGKGSISVGYKLEGVAARSGPEGSIVVTGRVVYANGTAPPPVLLYSYLLRGTITDASGKPVKGAVVTTRTGDRQYWTQSRPSGANGSYASFLVAADTLNNDPVPMTVGVAVGDTAYAEPATDSVDFAKLKSAVLNIQLPATPGAPLAKTSLTPQPIPGKIYQGLLVGVVGGHGRVIKPLSAHWPTADGQFQLVLPSSARGAVAKFWEADRQFFSTSEARPGGPIDPNVYPKSLPADAPQNLATIKLPG
jgi:PQQ-dependent dehydrogenase (methanol/ethanol family)